MNIQNVPAYVRLSLACAADAVAAQCRNDGEDDLFDGYTFLRDEFLFEMPRAAQEAALADLRDNAFARKHAARHVRRIFGSPNEQIGVHVWGLGWRDVPAVALA